MNIQKIFFAISFKIEMKWAIAFHNRGVIVDSTLTINFKFQ